MTDTFDDTSITEEAVDKVHVNLSKPSESDMLFYYQRILPFKHIFKWLNHAVKPTKDFTMREFAYEFRLGAYQRYNSFSTADEFQKSVVSANPTRFEVGAIYTVNPKERKSLPKNAMKPISKELVFDIDLTDYDEIRTCCSKTDICTKCWKFIQVASEIISVALRDDFGFTNFIWVFSGRRGAHCWVSDKRARSLDEASRKTVVEYMNVLGSKSNKMGKSSLGIKKPFHPHVERSLDILKVRFSEIILEDQDPWCTSHGSEENWAQVEEMLAFIPEQTLRNSLKAKWKDQTLFSLSRQKWEDLNSVAQSVLKNKSQVAQLNEAKKDIIIYYMYPRLDIEVSKQMIHLLKSPFCIHPGTGNVCVPFDPSKNLSGNMEDDAYGFNPMTAPNLKKIQDEIETWDSQRAIRDSSEPAEGSDSPPKSVHDYEKSCLKPYTEYFSHYVNRLITEEMRDSGKRSSDPLEF
ncbi:prim-pol domain-containing protein [Metschnikowia bicuspidata var. bicuspidata NRRL YB-4993]|uniref:DNA primase n=1 Tax=Metschnikowia bicuspidata var. bicuspidata NRRL YB-4993 TaxID=869754 RepID=A0A1A0H4X7_9ASCO|nr:prim-pol domain-containing protein [Metschnikowia bicuspidata var. bicuspidata NRRL YB-4993]OBA18978.1 prim-pol domain-containing protein [Metschnikowia bicuspidata var. bicuspidata NRRL YB-4993]